MPVSSLTDYKTKVSYCSEITLLPGSEINSQTIRLFLQLVHLAPHELQHVPYSGKQKALFDINV